MSDLAWTAEVSAKCPGAVLAVRESAPGEAELRVAPDRLLEVLRCLRGKNYSFTYLSDLTAYDEQPASPRFHVVYELVSMLRHLRCSVIVPLGDDHSPSAPSVTTLWPGANWLEREVYDMFGIRFDGHPDLRRLLLPQQFVGYPLRKDFIVDYRQDFPESQEVVAVPGAEFFGKGVIEGGE